MSNETMVLTRKIQLLIDSPDKAFVHACYQKLQQWQYTCFRAANYIFTHHFIQAQLQNLLYLSEETKIKLADIKKDADGILTTSRSNTTYQVLSKNFKGDIPMNILGCLNHQLVSNFNKEKAAYQKGERSVRNYKRNIPIPFSPDEMLPITPCENYFIFSLFKIPFKTYLGKDYYDKRALLQNAIEGTVKLCVSAITVQKSKIFLLASFRAQKEKIASNENVLAEASLSVEYPISIRINNHRYNIGTREEFLYRRLAIQAARQRAQKNASFNRPGKGKKRKLKSMVHYSDMEKNYVNYRLHVYSRRLIDICVKHQVSDLLLVNQQEKEDMAKEDEFLLRNWSYFNLKSKIMYKASRVGINVITE